MILNLAAAMQEAGTKKEAVEYAAREAGSSGLERFAGGDSIVVGVLVIVLLVVLIWWLLHDSGHAGH